MRANVNSSSGTSTGQTTTVTQPANIWRLIYQVIVTVTRFAREEEKAKDKIREKTFTGVQDLDIHTPWADPPEMLSGGIRGTAEEPEVKVPPMWLRDP